MPLQEHHRSNASPDLAKVKVGYGPEFRRRIGLFASLIALAIAGVIAWRQGASLPDLLKAATGLPVSLLTTVFTLSAINYFLRFWRWEILLLAGDERLPRLRHLMIYLAGFSLTLTPAKAGEALRSIFLLRYGISGTRSLACLAVERVLDVISVAALAVLAVTIWSTGWIVITAGLIGGLLSIGSLIWLSRRMDGRLPARIPIRVQGWVQLAREMVKAIRPRSLVVALPLSLTGWTLEAFGLVLLARHFVPDASAIATAGVFGASVLVGAVSFLPGGLGTTELTMITLLGYAGLSATEAAVATATCRLATLWFAFALGLIALPFVGGGVGFTKRSSSGE